MNGIEKQAAFYRGYLPHERSLAPLTIMLTSVVALWLIVYLVAAVAVCAMTQALGAPPPQPSPVILPLRAS
jgi:hypothetical protein